MDGVRSLIGFIADNTSGILERTIEHATIVLGVMLVATVFSVVLGIAVQNRGLAKQVSLGTAGVLLTIPSLALFAIFIPLVGIGNRPAQIALFLYAILPILRNTVTGLDAVDPAIVEAAQGMGMGQFQQLVREMRTGRHRPPDRPATARGARAARPSQGSARASAGPARSCR